MKRSLMNLAHLMVLLLAVSVWAESPKAPKLEKPKNGDGRYALVLWEPGTPIPGDETKHMRKIEEPDYAKFGGTLLFADANRRVVDMPVKEARKLRKDPAVASLQRLWMGEPQSELVEPPEDSIEMRGIESETDTDLTWGPKAYQYDDSGNIKAIGADSFVYDTAGRLIRSTIGGKTESFQYDAFGNLIEKTVAGTNPVTIPVDGASNRMIGNGYDAQGNVTMREGKPAYAYDEMNMMTTFKGGRHMVYDADDERIGVIIDPQLSRWWIRDLEGNVLREYQGQVANQVWYWEQDWVYAEGQLVGAERVTFETQGWESERTYTFGGKRHYHLDHLDSVRMVTDNSGRSVSEHDYFAFGVTPTKAYQEQINWADPHIDAMRFTGHQREFLGFINTENTDYLDYMHARYYDPNLGRFLSIDPGFDVDPSQPQSWNSYTYVRNNPINYVDPTGRVTCTVTYSGINDGKPFQSECTTVTAPDPGPSPSMIGFLNGSSNSRQMDAFGRMRRLAEGWHYVGPKTIPDIWHCTEGVLVPIVVGNASIIAGVVTAGSGGVLVVESLALAGPSYGTSLIAAAAGASVVAAGGYLVAFGVSVNVNHFNNTFGAKLWSPSKQWPNQFPPYPAEKSNPCVAH